ncbi:hypothetical protein LPU83_pLPU83c_0431 (plasmid) [Rhizobium favelukesii]|uniref:Uncharacterized protein n=1 Tax=Rhizobium favelukesii TaxID=348824 RepID=W6RQ63_9HYPH|nr:hypothetical protein LPU83_pLPU83c_0431 [Rhizobium favelukesii]
MGAEIRSNLALSMPKVGLEIKTWEADWISDQVDVAGL